LKRIALLQVHLPKNCSDDYEPETDNNAGYVILSLFILYTVFSGLNNILICKECKKRVQFIDKNYSDKKNIGLGFKMKVKCECESVQTLTRALW